ncbi:MAG: asparagine synthase (glutamine-hydrolyzing) [bacterium]
MCGICGRYNFANPERVSLDELKKMNSLMTHRGPDDEGFMVDGRAGLAMRRLSIIDLSGGHQPISNENGSVWVVLNGEIYNFQELKEELIAKGHKFHTKTDTEVIVHLYEEMGPDCVTRLRGMFALAVWDKERNRLLLARDRIGKKPLLYTLQNGWLAFASELRCLLSLEGVSKELEPRALDMYLSLQYIPSPLTIFKSVSKLPPGHRLVVENSRMFVERYWDLPVGCGPSGLSLEETKQAVVEKLREAVKIRLISDVPLGAFLSGGIDSSIIVALMSRISDKPVKTFSIGFEEAEFSELSYASQVAMMYGCEHTEFIVKPEMADILPKLAWHYGEPYADSSALPSYYVARETREFVTVALNGDGGDENFAGYMRYVAMKLAHYWEFMPAPLRRTAAGIAELLPENTAPYDIIWKAKRFLRSTVLSGTPEKHLRMASFFSPEEKNSLFSRGMTGLLEPSSAQVKRYFEEIFERSAGEDFINRLLYADFRSYLPECLMVKMDIATMANSMEGRSPFLDHEFVELVYGIRGNWKLKGLNNTKWLLREAFREILPPSIYSRGKQGFGIPLGAWFRDGLKKYWEERCLSDKSLKRGWFRPEIVRRFWEEHQGGRKDHGFKLWALLMLEIWHEQYAPDWSLDS